MVTPRAFSPLHYPRAMVPEASIERTDAGLVAAGAGWFVVNARDARWVHREGRGAVLPFTGWWEEEAVPNFPQFGVNLFVLEPGDVMSVYHGEEAQEDFLVLSGRGVLLVEGEERALERVGLRPLPRLDRAHDRRRR